MHPCIFRWPFKPLFRIFPHSVVPALVDRLGDAKDQVREQAQALILKLMEQTATPMVS